MRAKTALYELLRVCEANRRSVCAPQPQDSYLRQIARARGVRRVPSALPQQLRDLEAPGELGLSVLAWY
jgi:hypothetical protein